MRSVASRPAHSILPPSVTTGRLTGGVRPLHSGIRSNGPAVPIRTGMNPARPGGVPGGPPAKTIQGAASLRTAPASGSAAVTGRHLRRPAAAARRRDVCAMVLAAGLGKRMLSESSKLVHAVAGRPMVRHVVEAAKAAGMARTVVVVGNQADDVRRAVGEGDKRIGFAYQNAQLGTGHAVLSAEAQLLGYEGDVLILNGDLPALRPDTLKGFLDFHRASGAPLSLMTAVVSDPKGYGRVMRTYSGDVSRIVEESDATAEERATREINCGIYCSDVQWLWDPLKRARADNAKKEIYLTDLVEILRRDGHKVAAYRHPDPEEVLGVNDRRELAAAVRALHRRKAAALMQEGVTILDPETAYIDVEVKVGSDTIIEPGVMLLGSTEVGRGVTIGTGTRIADSIVGDGTAILPYCVIAQARIGRGCRIGPFAHLRPETHLEEDVRVGNFVEIKKTRMAPGSKANHLTYLGDAEVGRKANIGAGTITCNFDGVSKLRTVIEDEVFVGSDTQLVAPVRIRKGAFIGAGSTITKDVPPYALAVSRAEQVVKEDWVKRFGPQARRKGDKSKGGRSD
jgi:bifunctional UDP-N-acetylglucosamine pyrophosphorylase/glucosamine-1-phosphate N-acetyltransferase